MLNPNEKEEMLNDAACTDRRDAFRRARENTTTPSFDDYLRFLDKVNSAFNQATQDIQKFPDKNLKL